MTYLIDEKNLERQQILAEQLMERTLRFLQKVSVAQEAEILDLGCGLGETTKLLASHFSQATVTGIDQDADLLHIARQKGQTATSSMTFLQADATKLPFADHTFDFVFARYLLLHMEDPLVVLKEMKRVCKPGGIVFAQEPDFCSFLCYPESWAFEKVNSWFSNLFSDALVGRKLESFFNTLALKNISIQAEIGVETSVNHKGKKLVRLTGEAMGEALLTKGLIDAEDLGECLRELLRVEHDEHTFFLGNPDISAIGIV